MSELLIIPVMRVGLSESGQLIIMKKFLEGVLAYAERWSSQVTVLVRQTSTLSEGLDPVVFNPDEYIFNVELLPTDSLALKKRLSRAVIVLGTIDRDNFEVGQVCSLIGVPIVWITECTVKTRSQIISREASDIFRKVKRKASNQLLEISFRKHIANATGVQCNGTPTYQAYKNINQNTLLFFDSRIHLEEVISEHDIQAKADYIAKGLPLRLGFSGRLIDIKGVEHLPRVAVELKKLAIPFTLDIFGDGYLKSRLMSDIDRLELSSQVYLREVLDFHTELLPTLQKSIDLFLCCHPQGDPSCTYLETMACGVPIIGYANEAWEGMYNLTKVGRLIEMGNVKQMAKAVASIAKNRSEWLDLALAARNFAAKNTFEETMTKRIEHLKQSIKLN